MVQWLRLCVSIIGGMGLIRGQGTEMPSGTAKLVNLKNKIPRASLVAQWLKKTPPANTGDVDSTPGLGRSHIPQSN